MPLHARPDRLPLSRLVLLPLSCGRWFLMHFPCTGLASRKAHYMTSLLDAFYSNGTTPVHHAG